MMEQNPFAAIENNAIGTSLLAEAALDQPDGAVDSALDRQGR